MDYVVVLYVTVPLLLKYMTIIVSSLNDSLVYPVYPVYLIVIDVVPENSHHRYYVFFSC